MVRVFLSYSHGDGEHEAQVHQLADRLAGENGITVLLDRDTGPGGPDEGWPAWSERQVREADRVLIACSAQYARRYEGNDGHSERGKGTVIEARAIQQYLYDAKGKNARFRVVVLNPADADHIPHQLLGYQWFAPREGPSYGQLVSWLKGGTNVPAAVPEGPLWPRPDDEFRLTLADRRSQFESIRSALSGRSSSRIFLLKGEGASGKTEFSNQLIAYAEHIKIPWVRFDFKGAPPIEEFFQEALLQLGAKRLPLVKAARSPTPLLEFVEDLGHLTTPVLFLFDTYEKASEDGRSWVESKFLPRMHALRAGIVVVGGRVIPDRNQYPWRSLAETHHFEPIQNAEDWREYVERVHMGALQLHQIETLTVATRGQPGYLRQLLETLIQELQQKPRDTQ